MTEVISEYEKDLIATLRKEASDVKDCYTRYSFQAIVFVAAVLGIAVKFQDNFFVIAFASIASILLLVTVARIGVYKYGTANRNYGYELHLFRTKHLPEDSGNGWKSEMRQVGWEEAMRAWRVVQVTVFAYLYETRKFRAKKLRKNFRNDPDSYKWFDLEELVEPKAEYYPGSYLFTMNDILFLLAFLSSIPLMITIIQFNYPNLFLMGLGYALGINVELVIIHFYIHDLARRKLLESGLLSIHSCSIMWQAVVVAHYRALNNTQEFKHYTEHLANQANDLIKMIFNIHEWVHNRDNEKAKSYQPEDNN